MGLNFKQRADWLAHVLKAAVHQHHVELRGRFAPHIPEDGVVFDVGAHAGQFAKLFAGLAPRGVVYAFEPSPYALSVLKPALAFNRVRNVRIIPYGLSDMDGEAVLKTPIKSGGGMGFGVAHLGADDGSRPTVDAGVKLTTADAFAAAEGLRRVHFIKADIEGWEAQMLRGAQGILARDRPALFLEVFPASLARAGATPDDVWNLLTPLGYRAMRAPDFETVDRFAGEGDYLFVGS